jgi:hypothetical protein
MPAKYSKPMTGEFSFISGCHIAKLVGVSYRVYDDESEYANGSVKTVKLGKYERDARGNPVQFESPDDADKWVKGGKVIHPEVQFGFHR